MPHYCSFYQLIKAKTSLKSLTNAGEPNRHSYSVVVVVAAATAAAAAAAAVRLCQ